MKGRHLIYVPEIAGDTFVLFHAEGDKAGSFSIRDYSFDPPSLRYAGAFPPEVTSQQIEAWTQRPGSHAVSADAVSTDDVAYWRAQIKALNDTYLGADAGFTLLDPEVFVSLPKAQKTTDVHRMRTSANSEDWVTWNVIRFMHRRDPARWWPRLLGTAAADAGMPLDIPAPTTIHPWVTVPTPVGYESASRSRMAASGDPALVTRSAHPDPVEGSCEIDAVFTGDGYTLYVEAKLGSDISIGTTYDPYRNQIVRSIDCVIEHGQGAPMFWMFVKNRGRDRLYMQTLERYRSMPETLHAALPHRDPAVLDRMISTAAVLTWSEILGALDQPGEGEEVVWEELDNRTRVGGSTG